MNDRSRASVHIGTSADSREGRTPVEEPGRFSILIIGDFRGTGNSGPLSAALRSVEVDRDNFDEVFRTVGPRLATSHTLFEFKDLDDFHPDRLLQSDIFSRLLEGDPSGSAPAPSPPTPPPPPPPTGRATPAGLLDQIVDESEPPAFRRPAVSDDLADLIRGIVGPHLVPREDASGREKKAQREALTAEALRRLLHHPRFQKLEALWRATDWLVHRLDTDGDLRTSILDISASELLGHPETARRILCDGPYKWALIVLDHCFGQTAEDARGLKMMGHIARDCGAPLLAEAAAPSGEPSVEWQELRRAPEAKWIGLALPRFLLRLPYGKGTSPVETFSFEEIPHSVHQDYLWGNPAFCCAALLGQSFLDHGWQMLPGMHSRLDGLPLHVYREGAESVAKPCAEIVMSENDAEFLLEQGIMPLASVKDQDAAVLVRFQSLADPPAGLSGRWG